MKQVCSGINADDHRCAFSTSQHHVLHRSTRRARAPSFLQPPPSSLPAFLSHCRLPLVSSAPPPWPPRPLALMLRPDHHPRPHAPTRADSRTTKLNMSEARMKTGATLPATLSVDSEGCGKSLIRTLHPTLSAPRAAKLSAATARSTAACRGSWMYRLGSWKDPLK